jgi:hypothetical protein
VTATDTDTHTDTVPLGSSDCRPVTATVTVTVTVTDTVALDGLGLSVGDSHSRWHGLCLQLGWRRSPSPRGAGDPLGAGPEGTGPTTFTAPSGGAARRRPLRARPDDTDSGGVRRFVLLASAAASWGR